jgi:glutamate racemase
MEQDNRPIAVMDSGVGGISVLREMVRIMPHENFIFFGDSANAPYGTKSTEFVRDLTVDHVNSFLDRGAKAIAIACNTATAAALKDLRGLYPDLPMVGIEPALKPAVEANPGGRVLVMATPMTIREQKFNHLLSRFEDRATIYPLPCPGLMDYVEAGKFDSPELYKFLEELLWDYRNGEVDAVVLGCTHYPFVRKAIATVLGPDVEIFDGAEGTARELKRRIEAAGVQNKDEKYKGTVVFENSDPTPKKMALCKKLLKID